MSELEKDLALGFQEVTTRNVKAAVNHGNETRQIVRQLEEKIKKLEQLIYSRDMQINQLRTMIAGLQAKVFRGGTVEE